MPICALLQYLCEFCPVKAALKFNSVSKFYCSQSVGWAPSGVCPWGPLTFFF